MVVIIFLALNVLAFDYAECVNPALAGKEVPSYCTNE